MYTASRRRVNAAGGQIDNLKDGECSLFQRMRDPAGGVVVFGHLDVVA